MSARTATWRAMWLLPFAVVGAALAVRGCDDRGADVPREAAPSHAPPRPADPPRPRPRRADEMSDNKKNGVRHPTTVAPQ